MFVAILLGCEGGCPGEGAGVNANVFRNFFVYVASTGDDKISMYKGNKDGTLTPLGTIASGSEPTDIAVDTLHARAYVANGGERTLGVYKINADGTLTFDRVFATGEHPTKIWLDARSGLAVVCDTGRSAHTWSINQTTGELEGRVNYNTGPAPSSIAISGGTYILNSGNNTIGQFKQNGDPMVPPTVATGANPVDIIDSVGQMHVLNRTDASIQSYSWANVNTFDFSLVPIGAPAAAPAVAQQIIRGARGFHAFSSSELRTYVSNSQGSLNPFKQQSFGATGIDFAVSGLFRDGESVEIGALTTANNKVRMYEFDANGSLGFVAEYNTGDYPIAVAISGPLGDPEVPGGGSDKFTSVNRENDNADISASAGGVDFGAVKLGFVSSAFVPVGNQNVIVKSGATTLASTVINFEAGKRHLLFYMGDKPSTRQVGVHRLDKSYVPKQNRSALIFMHAAGARSSGMDFYVVNEGQSINTATPVATGLTYGESVLFEVDKDPSALYEIVAALHGTKTEVARKLINHQPGLILMQAVTNRPGTIDCSFFTIQER